jgi:hypothetical protein
MLEEETAEFLELLLRIGFELEEQDAEQEKAPHNAGLLFIAH